VTIAGGGIAGLTAAVYLARRGCKVTLYEEKSMLGGNLATRPLRGGGQLDVYPHMFQGWYHNFWQLMSDVGVDLGRSFTPFNSVHQLKRGSPPELTTLTYPYSSRYLLKNLSSGVASPPDMFVFGCATLDLLAEVGNPTVRLRNLSLTGYLNSRLYMTKAAIDAYENFITRVWAIPAYQVSASECRKYAAYCYAAAEEDNWLTTGPAAEAFLKQIETTLRAEGVRIVKKMRLERVELDANSRVQEIILQPTVWSERRDAWVNAKASKRKERVEDLVLALPPTRLARLVRAGKRPGRIVDALPHLAELERVDSQRVPMLQLGFNRKLADIPPDPVGLFGSRLNLAFTDISQTWTRVRAFRKRTVLAVSCSEPFLLPGPPAGDRLMMMQELGPYLGLDLGKRWGGSRDIDWSLSRFHTNSDAQLSLNAVGSGRWRPESWYKKVDNLFFAGDGCRNAFGITTVEAAVATGLAAVNEVIRLRMLGDKLDVKIPHTLPDELWVVLRYAWLPSAYAARGLAMMQGQERGGAPISDEEESLIRYLLTPGRRPRHHTPGG
jgi:phytoene dehydrogenase-like protein